MGRSLNKILIIGRIQPNDPELRYTQNGQPVCTFKMVTDESYRDKDGNSHDRSEWHRIVFWGKAGEIIAQYMKKGNQMYVEGRIQTRQYDQDGQTRYITEIVGRDFLFLDSAQGGQGGGGSPEKISSENAATVASDSGGADDDDLPF